MGWFENWWSGGDHLKDVDPNLRKFLEEQQPKTYKAASQSSRESESYRSQLGLTGHVDPEAQYAEQQALLKGEADAVAAAAQRETRLPRESLFQDGRYKHLWKNYRPQQEVEEAGKSDQEKLLDIVDSFKDRQAGLGRAAMENCSNEQWAVHDCFRSGSLSARLTMCRSENRQLNRCLDMQKRFLQALGYATLAQRPRGEAEKIQMHADHLYQRYVKQEEAIEAARKNGQPVPSFDSLFADQQQTSKNESAGLQKSVPSSTPQKSALTWEGLPESTKAELTETRLKGLSGVELDLEKRALEHEIMVSSELIARVGDRYATEYQERKQRLEEGRPRISDRIKGWFDTRDYSSLETSAQQQQQQQQPEK